ncbi:MAG: DegT/DnrJ/EryC1/StrS family aminotransferase [Nitrososphaerales archaeon]
MQSEKTIAKKIIPSMKPYLPEEDIQEIIKGFETILRSGRLTLGKYTSEFEEKFAKYSGVKYAVAANSGTCTLEMIYRSLGIAGKEVITPTNTHISTSNTVLFAGGSPVLADMEEDSLCIDVEDAFSKVTEKTAAIVVVHVSGLIHPRIYEIARRCKEMKITLIEDAAHAHGAMIDGRKAGSLSEAGSFSFYPAKVMTTVEGGMITTNNEEIAMTARELRNHGSDSSGLQVMLGYNWRMSELHSMLGLVQLSRIEEIISRKQHIASRYIGAFADSQELNTINVPHNMRHSYYKFPVVLGRQVSVERVKASMKAQCGIETGSIYYPPCHLQPVYQRMFPRNKFGDLKTSEDVLRRTITLPIYAGMEETDVDYVVDSLLTSVKKFNDTTPVSSH